MIAITVTPEFAGASGKSSPIRRMFEKGLELKAKFGADAVSDFSLGNPDLPPPAGAAAVLRNLAAAMSRPYSLGYCPNAGAPAARSAVARRVSNEQKTPLPPDAIVMTCGAAGALVCIFRAIVAPGDEIIVPSPYFVEYANYCGHFGGRLRPVAANGDFSLDLAAIESAVNGRTRAILINSPNNPTGAIYDESSIAALGALVERENAAREARGEQALLLISDEPYRAFAYDGAEVPPVMPHCRWSVVAGSFSKTLSLAGERVGYIALHPAIAAADGGALVSTLVLVNRTLGYVNAPVAGQALAAALAGESVDITQYVRRRALMAKVLDDAQIEYVMPRGAFYFFPKAPGGDDARFANALLEERILAVAGTQFGLPGFFRLSYSTDEKSILRSVEGFRRAAAACR